MRNIAKTELTILLERKIHQMTNKMGVFSCFEVTIGWFGDERVDYMTYDTKNIWRCYEIKVSKSDFYSKAKKTFIGHYNYFVMPRELFKELKDDIPSHIGVYTEYGCEKRAKKQELPVDEQVLKDSMIRSLSRESEKLRKSENPQFVEQMNRRISREKKEKENYRRQYEELVRDISNKYGRDWWK